MLQFSWSLQRTDVQPLRSAIAPGAEQISHCVRRAIVIT
jgi:hypothetical protein